MQNRTQKECFTGSMKDLGGQVVQMANPKEFDAAKALIELAYGHSHLPNSALPSFPVLESSKQNANRVGGDGKMKTSGERLHFPLEEAKRVEKRKAEDNFSLSNKKKHKASSIRGEKKEEKSKSPEVFESFASNGHNRFGMEPVPSQKAMADMTRISRLDQYDPLRVKAKVMINELTSLKKKVGLQNESVRYGSLGGGKIYEPCLSKKEDGNKAVPKKISAKKQGKSVTTPSHTGISFSVVHLLSAVRTALIAPHAKHYALVYNKQLEEAKYKGVINKNPVGVNGFYSPERDVSLKIHQIVQLMRLKPGHRSILEIKEPLQDLVKGVLMLLSSKKAPLGASGWNPLTVYEKTRKTWSWVGHVSFSYPHDRVETSTESWGIPCQTLAKLVGCFVKWIKEREEALQKISSLPPAPLALMQPPSLEERFKDTKALKRISTISPSCDEIRAYFRREEALRYSMPERAFSYTALDGKKSAVAPLRRGSGKPIVRGREHFMLKEDRPPSFTILCLVRDAAARLPGGVGTRGDVIILARDSQFIVEETEELQFNRAISGGLDRLHFDDDPCVQFDKDKQVWVYLHGENEEVDFEHVGTASGTRRRRRRRPQDTSGESN